MLLLPEIVAEASEAEPRETEDFAVWTLSRALSGIFRLDAHQDMDFGKAGIGEIEQVRRDLYDSLVRNLRKVGLLTGCVTPGLPSFGMKLAAWAAVPSTAPAWP